VAVELEEIVGRGDEPPFGAAGGSAAALEAADLAVELDLSEDGLDRGLALAVERARWQLVPSALVIRGLEACGA
jgi:hypothetical protein